MKTAQEVLEQIYGYDQFRPFQREAIDSITSGIDTFVLMPTGGGKSLCYAVPSVMMGGVTVVVSPLISLMKDQVDGLRSNGIPAAFLNSSLSEQQQAEVLQQALGNELRLLYVAPERMVQPQFRQLMRELQLNFVAIDEAHCISQWGHDFRLEYRQLSFIKQEHPELPIMALTATATDRVRRDIVDQLHLESPQTLVASFYRPNLHYSVEPKRGTRAAILEFIRQKPGQAGIVYCQSRKKVEAMAEFLQLQGIRAGMYHAGLEDEVRLTSQEKFRQDEVEVMVATVAFGMGIDKPNIRYVIHHDAPQSLEHYYQETGRAGRDGEDSQCILFFSSADLEQYRRFADDLDEVERQKSYQRLKDVQRFARSSQCRHGQLLKYFNEVWDQKKCQSCDNCVAPQPLIDATQISQKILSCVYHLKRGYSPTYISLLLTGSDDARIVQNGHSSLSTYGIVSDYTPAQIRHIISELENLELLAINPNEFNAVHLTERSLPVLRGAQSVYLSEYFLPGRDTHQSDVSPLKSTSTSNSNLNNVDKDLFEKLRQLRLTLARQSGMPPYIIFTDKSLMEIANAKPMNLAEFGRVYGVGQQKLDKYGAQFLEVVQGHVGAE